MKWQRKPGIRYEFTYRTDWENIVGLATVTKDAIVDTIAHNNISELEANLIQEQMTRDFMTPSSNQSFKEYQAEVFSYYFGDGARRTVAHILFPHKVVLQTEFGYGQPAGELNAVSFIQPDIFQTAIFGNGFYERKATGIAEMLQSYSDSLDLTPEYKRNVMAR